MSSNEEKEKHKSDESNNSNSIGDSKKETKSGWGSDKEDNGYVGWDAPEEEDKKVYSDTNSNDQNKYSLPHSPVRNNSSRRSPHDEQPHYSNDQRREYSNERNSYDRGHHSGYSHDKPRENYNRRDTWQSEPRDHSYDNNRNNRYDGPPRNDYRKGPSYSPRERDYSHSAGRPYDDYERSKRRRPNHYDNDGHTSESYNRRPDSQYERGGRYPPKNEEYPPRDGYRQGPPQPRYNQDYHNRDRNVGYEGRHTYNNRPSYRENEFGRDSWNQSGKDERPSYESGYPPRGSPPRYQQGGRTPAERDGRGRRAIPANVPPSKAIGLFGLSIHATEEDIKDFLKEHIGNIKNYKIIIVYDKFKRTSKGYGFVYFDTLDDAITAKEKLTGQSIKGKEVRVDYSTNDSLKSNRYNPESGYQPSYKQL